MSDTFKHIAGKQMTSISKTLETIGWVDGMAILVIVFLIVRGFLRGCSGELGRLIALCTAAAVGYFGFTPLFQAAKSIQFLKTHPETAHLIVVIAAFVVCIALWLGLKTLLAESIKLAIPQPFDSILGGVFGGIKALIFVAVLCTLGLMNPAQGGRRWFSHNSMTVDQLSPVIQRITAPE